MGGVQQLTGLKSRIEKISTLNVFDMSKTRIVDHSVAEKLHELEMDFEMPPVDRSRSLASMDIG